jgi:REP element-mobilizing transposase RayT
MVRGIDRRSLFRDDRDRAAFVARLGTLAAAAGLSVYAWALLRDHAHILVRTGVMPLARVMRRLLTGYAGAFNRRHHRHGHVFANRYKSIVVEDEPYFLVLVRYVHLNPLRANVVPDLRTLDRYPWTGHSALLGREDRRWQATAEVLARFAGTAGTARARYRAYVRAGMDAGRQPDLEGGGLRRSAGGWQAVSALRRGREASVADERVLGGSDFVAALRDAAEADRPHAGRRPPLARLVATVCAHLGICPESLRGSGRRDAVARAREVIAYLWIEWYGQSGRPLAEHFGVQLSAVHRAAKRGGAAAKEWESLLAVGQDQDSVQ